MASRFEQSAALARRYARWPSPDLIAGVALCAALTAAAEIGARWSTVPMMLQALLLGIAVRAIAPGPVARMDPGLSICSKHVLRLGVILLGLRVMAGDLAGLGWRTILLVLLSVAGTICGGFGIARLLRLPRDIAAVSATSVAICGASAALAAASAAPKRAGLEGETAVIILTVSLLSSSVMLLYPLLAGLFGYDSSATSLLLGAAIHDIAQVVGAGFAISPQVGVEALTIKLIRIACLLPAVIGVSLALRGADIRDRDRAAPAPVPMFLLGFLLLAMIASSGVIAPPIRSFGTAMATWCLAMAIVAIGLKTSLAGLRTARRTLLLAMILQTLLQLAIVTTLIRVMAM